MVQYVFTPWRDRDELLLVRQQFYAARAAAAAAAPVTTRAHSDDHVSQPGRVPRRGHSSRSQQAGSGGAAAAAAATAAADDGAGAELLRLRRRRQDQHTAVARVSMWVQRGNCPHMVESTAVLTAAMLSDEEASETGHAASATYAVRAAYAAAFSRFVTGLLDSHQDKQRKQSMYGVAKTIGLPATFVELRHQSTHEQLPSRAKLRSAAVKALGWIWDYYWSHLAAPQAAAAAGSKPEDADPCAAAVLRYLREGGDEAARRQKLMAELLRRWGTDRLLRSVAQIQDSLPGNQVYLKCVTLKRELMPGAERKGDTAESLEGARGDPSRPDQGVGGEELRRKTPALAETARDVTEQEDEPGLDTGWSRYQGPWKPKPIGVV